MFYHIKELQCKGKPDRPDSVYAKKLQEIPGEQYGEMNVMGALPR
ncbi:manganese catalase family protein [Mesobacillus selenatarsenatis]